MQHEEALKGLFVQVLGLLSVDGLVTLERVMQDGTKIRAWAARDSFRTKEGIEKAMKAAQEQVEAVDELPEEESSRRMVKARERAQRERQGADGIGAEGVGEAAGGRKRAETKRTREPV